MLKKSLKKFFIFTSIIEWKAGIDIQKIFKFEKFKLDPEFVYQWDILNTSLKMTISLDSYIENKLFFDKNYGKEYYRDNFEL